MSITNLIAKYRPAFTEEQGQCQRTLRVRCNQCGAYAELHESDIMEYVKHGCPNGCVINFSKPEDISDIKCEKCGKPFRTANYLKEHKHKWHSY